MAISHHYAVIVGNGRSGSNWLLTMLDASPFTHCRNEPQEILQSPFHQLPDPFEILKNPQEMEHKWHHFVAWTASHMGERDHRIIVPKNHVYPLSQQLGIAALPARPRIQNALKSIFPNWRRGEWKMPWWIGNQQKLCQAYAVFKINDLRSWYVKWLLEHHSNVPVLHIVRHPGGQLNSGINRFFAQLDFEARSQEQALYQNILKMAVTLEPEWENTFGTIQDLGLIEAVAWFWRYNNETIYNVGQHYQNYLRLVYEDLAQNPLKEAKKVYQLCNLSWDQNIEEIILQGMDRSMWGKLADSSKSVAQAWQNQLQPEYQTIANKVLKGSIMEEWWS